MHAVTSTSKKIVRRILPRSWRNWARSPASSLRWLWGELGHVVGVHPTVEAAPGWRIRCHPVVYRAVTTSQLSDPAQIEELRCFIGTCSCAMVLFDLGAHFGVFSLAATHYGGRDARAVAVEPSPAAGGLLRTQARLNDVARRLHVVHAAAGAEPGWTKMLPVGVIADGYFVSDVADHPAHELVTVRVVTIDHLADDLRLTPTHVKIDVEGAEAAVLRGGERVFSGDRAPLLFVELHNELVRRRGANPQEAVDLLVAYGYARLTVGERSLRLEQLLDEPVVRVVARKG